MKIQKIFNFKSFFIATFIFSTLQAGASPTQIRIATIQEWDVFHPISYQTAASEAYLHFLFRDMTYRDEKGKVIVDIAQELPTKANGKVKEIGQGSEKKLQAIWKIRSNANWGDGTAITCADWEFGWQVGLNDNVSKQEKEIYTKIEKIEFTDREPKTCTVTYKNTSWGYDRDLPPFLPKHLEYSIYQKHKDRPQAYEQNSLYITQPNNPGLYSGPYVVSEIKLASHVIFKKNTHFYGQQPSIDTVIIKHIGNTNTLKNYLMTNDIDAIGGVGFPQDLAITFDQELDKAKYKIHFKNAPLFQALFFNSESPLLKDMKVRQALALAIDKKKIAKAFFNDKLNPAETIISESDKAFVRKKAIYNLNEAKSILEAAGWKPAADGIRQKNGQRLELTFKVSAGIKLYESMQVVICDDFKKIGVACKIKNEPPRTLLGDSVPKGEFEIAMFGQNTYPDTSLKGLYHSSEIPSSKNAWAGGNIIRLASKSVDRLVEKYDQDNSSESRIKILRQLDNEVINGFYVVPLYHRRESFLAPAKLSGIQMGMKGTAIAYPETWTWN